VLDLGERAARMAEFLEPDTVMSRPVIRVRQGAGGHHPVYRAQDPSSVSSLNRSVSAVLVLSS
jgi:hypothetical protein